MNDFPIGVFDSGVGGLTVLRALSERWPNEQFLYLADTARLPYGAKSPETIEQYLVQNLGFLLKEDVKAVIVACNTASTVLLQKKIPSPVPILNVIMPGARRAAKLTQTGRIGVIGTRATILSNAYVQAAHSFNTDIEVYQQSCPLLVPLIEENWIDDPLTNMVIYRYLQNLLRHPIDTLILGCTHYPILKSSIERVVGPSIQLVDSAAGLIDELETGFTLRTDKGQGAIHIACTDLTAHLEQLMAKLLSPLSPKSIRLVDLGR